jgi:uncharacterized protein
VLGPSPARLVETHVSILVFAGDRAYKVKKPVDFGFLDLTHVEQRRAACLREVELNRRLAPDVYLGVAELRDPDGGSEPLVKMRRMPEDRRLGALASSGADLRAPLHAVARAIAALHAGSPRRAEWDATATRDAVAGRWQAGFDELRPLWGTSSPEGRDWERLEALVDAYLAGRGALFDARIAHGWIRDGHGDLLAEDIFCMDDGPRILDCLEFDEDLRVGDVLADIGFLAMDLERLGRADMAEHLLGEYRELLGAAWPASLEHHYLAYRAQVRCKVRALAAAQGDPAGAGDARGLLGLSLSHMERAQPRLVLVGGLPGTGKSTLARGLADTLGFTLLRSDVVRKELTEVPDEAPAPASFAAGIYAPRTTDRTYETLLDRAELLLSHGESVILDASWSARERRQRARRLATHTSSQLVELRCVCPRSVADDRLRVRQHQRDASDATPEVAALMADRFAEWPEASEIATDRSESASLEEASRALNHQPPSEGSSDPGPRSPGPRA